MGHLVIDAQEHTGRGLQVAAERVRSIVSLRSLRRAKRTLAYIEEQGLLVCQLDGMGRRRVTLVDPAWATTPNDPAADEMADAGCELRSNAVVPQSLL